MRRAYFEKIYSRTVEGHACPWPEGGAESIEAERKPIGLCTVKTLPLELEDKAHI